MGVVEGVRHRHPSLRRPEVAAHAGGKTTDARERFLREARAAGLLQHPNLVTLYDLGEAEGQLYIAMELVEGRI